MNLPKDTQNIIRSFIKTRILEAEREGVVIGLSGGIDSATVLELVTDALGNEKVVGMIMPDGTKLNRGKGFNYKKMAQKI